MIESPIPNPDKKYKFKTVKGGLGELGKVIPIGELENSTISVPEQIEIDGKDGKREVWTIVETQSDDGKVTHLIYEHEGVQIKTALGNDNEVGNELQERVNKFYVTKSDKLKNLLEKKINNMALEKKDIPINNSGIGRREKSIGSVAGYEKVPQADGTIKYVPIKGQVFNKRPESINKKTEKKENKKSEGVREVIKELLKNKDTREKIINILNKGDIVAATHGNKYWERIKGVDSFIPQTDLDAKLTGYLLSQAGIKIKEQQFLEKGAGEDTLNESSADIFFDSGEQSEIIRIGKNEKTGKEYLAFGNHYADRKEKTSTAEVATILLDELKDSLIISKGNYEEITKMVSDKRYKEFIQFNNDSDNLLVPKNILENYKELLPKTLYGNYHNLSFEQIKNYFKDGGKKDSILEKDLLSEKVFYNNKKITREQMILEKINGSELGIKNAEREMKKMGINSTHPVLGKFLLNAEETSPIKMREVIGGQKYDASINVKYDGVFVSKPGENIEALAKELQKKYPEVIAVNSMILYFPKDAVFNAEEFLNDLGVNGYTQEKRNAIWNEYVEKQDIQKSLRKLNTIEFKWPKQILDFYKDTEVSKIREFLIERRRFTEADREVENTESFKKWLATKEHKKQKPTTPENNETIKEPVSFIIFDLEETDVRYEKARDSLFKNVDQNILKSIAQKIHDGYTLTSPENTIYSITELKDTVDDLRETIEETRLEGLDRNIKKTEENIAEIDKKIELKKMIEFELSIRKKENSPDHKSENKEEGSLNDWEKKVSNRKIVFNEGEINTGEIKIADLPKNIIDKKIKDTWGNELDIYINNPKLQGILLEREGNYLFRAVQERFFVLCRVGEFYLPFYISSAGTSGKKQGEWYPFFGYTGSWLVKGGVNEKGEMLYSNKITEVQKTLNENFKFPSGYFTPSGCLVNDGNPVATEKNTVYDIKKDTKYEDWFITFDRNSGKNLYSERQFTIDRTGLNPNKVKNKKDDSSPEIWISNIIKLIENK